MSQTDDPNGSTPPPAPPAAEDAGGQSPHQPIRITDEMRSSYMDYAMSVIIGRALPDVRDGLKPVHRRVLFAQYEQSNSWNRPYKKSARIVGDVIGKYHPHGDSSVYDALVRMAQPFSMRLPLVDGQGNFGSVDGDPPAAMRYTEVRMTRATSELLADIEKETVDFGPNYDGSEKEPLVLPTRIPNLLVNGSEGIAVGMATRIPPHNLSEVIGACIEMIDNPDCTLDDLMRHIKGPDFPTHAMMYGMDGVREAYETGRGVLRIRSRTHIETDHRTNKDSIIITELPYQVNKARLIEKIAELVREKSIDGITDLRDESDRTGMRVVIELRRDANTQVVENHLYRKTQMEVSFGMNMLAIVNNQPRTLPLHEILAHFLDFRRDVVTRRCIFELRKARERMHILEALKRALDMIDAVIQTIRSSSNSDEANLGLQGLLDIDEVQADAILQLRLQRLTALEINKLIEEMDALRVEITRLETILNSEVELMKVIRVELLEIGSAYGEARRTEILPIRGTFSIEDMIADEDEVVTLSHRGYIKRTPIAEYRTQKRGGKGTRGMNTREEDVVSDVWVTNTHASLLVFLSNGRCFHLKVHELPAGGRTALGKPIVNMLKLEAGERVQAVLPFQNFQSGHYVITCTRKGQIKKTPLAAYRNVNVSGIIGVRVPEGDELIGVSLCRAGDRVMLVTRNGRAVTFDQTAARSMSRATQGVRGIKLRGPDETVSMVVVPREDLVDAGVVSLEDLQRYELADQRLAAAGEDVTDEEGQEEEVVEATAEAAIEDDADAEISEEPLGRTVLTVTTNGYGKRTPINAYPVKGRGGMGVITIKTSDRNGPVAGCRLVAPEDQLLLITDGGKVIRMPVAGVSLLGRNTQGVRMISLDRGEKVVGMARYDAAEEEVEDAITTEGVVAGSTPDDANATEPVSETDAPTPDSTDEDA